MSSVPPPYAPREHAQVQPGPPTSPSAGISPLEFAETTSVCLEWRLSGLRAMYDQSKGDAKSKCIKSAIFGDADNLWEVLWYPNSGVQGGEYASLYLSCVPTPAERDSGIGNKWTRKGLWWFRFEIKSTIPDERNHNKIVTLASKDASDHTFAVKTANWGWQQFAKRDSLFLHPTVVQADNFLIVCTIQAQSQPPAGYWLGMGLPPTTQVSPTTVVGQRTVGSGGGLSAWSGGEGASGGVAGGTTAGGGVKKVVPKDLVSSVGSLLDDQLYSDVEFIIPASGSRKRGMDGDRAPPRKIYANKKLLCRCDYFEAMFNGGFREVEGVIEDDDEDEDMDILSDSDVEDEAAEQLGPTIQQPNNACTTSLPPRRASTSADMPPAAPEQSEPREEAGGEGGTTQLAEGPAGEGHNDEIMEEDDEVQESPPKREIAPVVPAPALVSANRGAEGSLGPKKTKVMIRDAAWSTWWAVLYWIYTDSIYFAPLSSSFEPSMRSRPASISSYPPPSSEPRTRRDWIRQWTLEHGISSSPTAASGASEPLGPRPVSAKAVYRLADKLDLPALKLRAFQHICGGLTAGNIPAEVFSRFSSTFEDVRKVQVAFFLKHWTEIKKSETMMQIWQQIRLGKHVGFEEVWPLIVGQLDFKPS